MGSSDNFFDRWVEEAKEEVSNHGWKSASQNAVTLAAFGMMTNKIEKKVDKIAKPAWFIGVSIFGSVIWLIVSKIIGL